MNEEGLNLETGKVKDLTVLSDPANQDARAFLRERFLRVMTFLAGKRTSFTMAEKTRVQACFGGMDIDFQEVFVRDLETPLGCQPSALLRTTDIVSIAAELHI